MRSLGQPGSVNAAGGRLINMIKGNRVPAECEASSVGGNPDEPDLNRRPEDGDGAQIGSAHLTRDGADRADRSVEIQRRIEQHRRVAELHGRR